jgi:hypothetical protein
MMTTSNEIESNTLEGFEGTMEGESYEEESLLDETPPLIGPSDATILESVQAKLKKQLLDKKQELDEKIYQQNVALKKATKNREEAGVQLYDLQCNLAGLHLSLHKATTELHTTSDSHLKVHLLYAKNLSSSSSLAGLF